MNDKYWVELTCDNCGETFDRRISEVREQAKVYCSRDCQGRSVEKKCHYCGEKYRIKAFQADKSSYCSKFCMAEDYQTRLSGKNNPNYRGAGDKICEGCGEYYHSYDKKRKYCSRECYKKYGSPARGLRGKMLDANHKEIVEYARTLGVSVLDTAAIGGGFPDTIWGIEGINILVEIKNPDNPYYGVNGNQEDFADMWQSDVYVVYTKQDVDTLISCVFSGKKVPPALVI